MSNTPRKRAAAKPAPVDELPDPGTLPNVPGPDMLTFDEQWLIKAATGVDVLDPPIRGLSIAACLWFACRNLERPLTWPEAKRYRVDDLELGDAGLDEDLPRDEDGALETEDPTDGSETPSSA